MPVRSSSPHSLHPCLRWPFDHSFYFSFDLSLNHFDRKGDGHGKNYFLQYHSNKYFGLCFGDRGLSSLSAKDWKPWTKQELRQNIHKITGFEDATRANR